MKKKKQWAVRWVSNGDVWTHPQVFPTKQQADSLAATIRKAGRPTAFAEEK